MAILAWTIASLLLPRRSDRPAAGERGVANGAVVALLCAALVASLVGLVLGAAAWALGSHTNNYQYANTGRKAVLASGIAALLIGAAPTLVNFLFQTGHGIH